MEKTERKTKKVQKPEKWRTNETRRKMNGTQTGTSDFFMAFLISLSRPIESCSWVDPHHPLSVSIQRRDTALALSASMSLRRTGGQAAMPRHHWTSSCRACLTLSVSSTLPRMSSTEASSAKQCSCGDGPAESAATPESSSLPRRSSRMAFRTDSTNTTRHRADAKPVFTCMCLSGATPETPSHYFSSASARSAWFVNHDAGSLTNPDLPDSTYQRHMLRFQQHLVEQWASEYTTHPMMTRSMEVQ